MDTQMIYNLISVAVLLYVAALWSKVGFLNMLVKTGLFGLVLLGVFNVLNSLGYIVQV